MPALTRQIAPSELDDLLVRADGGRPAPAP